MTPQSVFVPTVPVYVAVWPGPTLWVAGVAVSDVRCVANAGDTPIANATTPASKSAGIVNLRFIEVLPV
jgi:hypothetical protein